RVVAAAWCEVLDRESVDPSANFFDVGGHSLLLAKLQLVLEKRLGRELPIVAFFQYPTVNAFAAYLTTDARTSAADVGAARARQRRGRMQDVRARRKRQS
ncbi:MAG TPA: acyl carrier protein, partial [Polyangiaceae bacterium]|nr:acyl carrier protein [Polyangiaceae bacterium]